MRETPRWRKQANHETRQTRQGSDEAAGVGHTSHTTPEYSAQEELRQVRQENRMLREERELLLRAATIFVTQISSIRSIR